MAAFDQVVHAKAIELGKLAVRATTAAGSGHPTTALSLAHLTTVLLYRVMRWDEAHPHDLGADRLVLSEGHAVPIVYAACADLGVVFSPNRSSRPMTVRDLMTLRDISSPIDGHPNPQAGFPFFDAATGSLGQGLSVAAGLAAAARTDSIGKKVYCLIGDGESREGQIWEAMDFIADQGLRNVVAIFNCNTLGQSDFVSEAQSWKSLQRKAEAFGWETQVIDGHAPTEIDTVLRRIDKGSTQPLCIVARTVKGWGIPDLQGMGHHGTPVPEDRLQDALDALDTKARELGADKVTPQEIRAALTHPPSLGMPAPKSVSNPERVTEMMAKEPKLLDAFRTKKRLSPRRAFGLALKALGQSNPNVVALDGDVKNSTYAQDFAESFPKRYFEGRIAEQNMISVAAGLAAGGKVPFASTFGKFMVRAFDQIEMAVIGGANIKLVGTHTGVTLAADGPSQMALSDVAFIRAFSHVIDHRGEPAITLLTPSDGISAYLLVLAMAAAPSACYLRAVRADLPVLYSEDEKFPFGGHKLLRDSGDQARKLVLVATGYLVHSCLEAAERLAERGIGAAVIDAYSLPMATQPLLDFAAETSSIILCAEDNYVGGIGSELAEAAAETATGQRIVPLCVQNFPKSGRKPDDVLSYVGLAVDDIVDVAMTLVL